MKINSSRYSMHAQKGISLIELMIAMLLGLVITAAAGLLLITNQSSFNLQLANNDLQDNGNFGLNFVTSDIKRANFGADDPVIDDKTLYGGIVFAQGNVTNTLVLDAAMMSRGNGETGWDGLSNAAGGVKSDQLTIQYKAIQNAMPEDQFFTTKLTDLTPAQKAAVVGADCEGNNITLEEVKKNTYIIQRYFLRKDTAVNGNEPNEPLALVCDAMRYSRNDIDSQRQANLTLDVTNPNGRSNGEIIMRRVDHFRVLLGVANGADPTTIQNMRYMSIRDYKALTVAKKPRVLSVQLGVITRSYDSAGSNSLIQEAPTITLLDQNITLQKQNSSADRKYVRDSLVQTIALRNALGLDTRS